MLRTQLYLMPPPPHCPGGEGRMEDCGGEGSAEEEEEREGRQQTSGDNREQHPENEDWWEGKEYPPTETDNPLCKEDLGRSHQMRRYQRQDCAGEWQSWTCNTTDEEKGREERRGGAQAG
jgi:hypothetical protein